MTLSSQATYQTVTGEYEEGGVGKIKKKKSDRALFEVAWKVFSLFFRLNSSLILYSRELYSTKVIIFVIQRPRWQKV
jgi:hypothetical protein